MVDTLVNLIVNIEEGWGNYFAYKVMPLKQKRPDLFPIILAVFANHPHWFMEHYDNIVTLISNKALTMDYHSPTIIQHKACTPFEDKTIT
jgi:hypothetical protein